MRQYTLDEFSSSGVVCLICGKESESYKGYAIHHSKSGGHDGLPLLDLVGEDRFRELYRELDYEELAEELGVGTSTLERPIDKLGLEPRTVKDRLEQKYGVPLDWLLDTLHNTLGKSANQMSKDLGVSRPQIKRWMDDEYDIPRRDQSEAEAHKWEQMTEAERAQQVKAAHERTRELAENGEDPLTKWRNSLSDDEISEIMSKHAALGAPARDKNGMEGRTGEDSPHWRGGQSLYYAIRRQIDQPSWKTRRQNNRAEECEKCGSTGRLELHHIVPVMAGGTNEPWNLMTLCPECHGKAEAYTWRHIVSPVYSE